MKKRYLPFAFTLFLLANSLFSQSWTPVGNNVLPGKYYTWALSAVDANTVYAICENEDYTDQKLIRTTDGGVNWDVIDLSVLPGVPMDIHAISADTIWIVYRESSGITKLYLSSDAAQTWQQKLSYQGNNVIGPALAFGDKESGYMVDPNVNKASRTSNGGNSWQTGNMPSFISGETWGMPNPTNWMDAKGDTIWWGTSKFIRRSTDNGLTWQSINNGFSGNVETKCVSFSQCGFGLAASNVENVAITGQTHISTSTDGGTNWAELSILDIPLEGISDVPGLAGAFVGVGGIFKDFVPNLPHQYVSAYTLDGGLNWTVIDSFPLNAVEFVSPDAGWAGTILSHDYGGNPLLFKWNGSLMHNRIYVNQNATGANTGTSWTNAYTDLQAALTAAQDGFEIWVAEGTYKPAAPNGPTVATYTINKNLRLYGGFSGTECYLAERDVAVHPTILSGDLNGNDVDDDFSAATRSDNVSHVLSVTAVVTNATVIDGFVIKGGQADGGGTSSFGGGIYCLGAPAIQQCIFTQNFSTSDGGGAYFSGTNANGTKFKNCRLIDNYAQGHGGGLATNNLTKAGFVLSGCEFTGNQAFSPPGGGTRGGGGIQARSSNLYVDGCTFKENKTEDFGGAIHFAAFTDSVSITVVESAFLNNESRMGGAMHAQVYHLQNLSYTGNKMMITKSNFSGNKSIETNNNFPVGGALYFYLPDAVGGLLSIDSCDFSNNFTEGNGGAVGVNWAGSNMDIRFTNSNLTENSADDFYATVHIWALSFPAEPVTGTVTVDNCNFEGNTTRYSGGLDLFDNSSASIAYHVKNSSFRQNHAFAYGGGLTLGSNANSPSSFNIENCVLENNTADERAGAVLVVTSSNKFQASMQYCRLENNHSPTGSALNTFLFDIDSYNLPAGAVFTIENSLIAGNTGDAAIELDSFPGLQLLNCTVTENHGGFRLANKSGLTLQNTIFYNPGFPEYEAATADVTFTSNGGNLIGDLSLNGQLLPSDKENLDPVFIGAGDYHLGAGSPGINHGVDLGNLSALDLDGNARVVGSSVDIGAYEDQTVAVQELMAENLMVSPNPANAFLSVQLPEEITGPFVIEVYNSEGKRLRSQSLIPGQRLDVQGLVPATYALKVLWEERVYAGKFVKQ